MRASAIIATRLRRNYSGRLGFGIWLIRLDLLGTGWTLDALIGRA
jgi:hypothetical protein